MTVYRCHIHTKISKLKSDGSPAEVLVKEGSCNWAMDTDEETAKREWELHCAQDHPPKPESPLEEVVGDVFARAGVIVAPGGSPEQLHC